MINIFGKKLRKEKQSRSVQDAVERARLGDPFAQTLVGFLAENGFGVPCEPEQAKGWYRQAADAGYAPAQYLLALLIDQTGEHEVALEYLSAAADQEYAPALLLLGVLHRNNGRLDLDLTKYEEFLERTRQQESEPQVTDAAEWERLRLAAKIGSGRHCQIFGALLVEKGKTQSERLEGLDWMREGCKRGDIAACLFLSHGHSFGHYGCEKSNRLARKYRSLANQLMSKLESSGDNT